jgi:hypothetical protein
VSAGPAAPTESAVAAAAVASAASGQEDAGNFTVAVSPIVHRSPGAAADRFADAIRAALLDALRAVPNLRLIELDEAPAARAAPNAPFESRRITLINGDDVTETTVVGQIETRPSGVEVEGGSETADDRTGGVVNVLLSGNVDNITTSIDYVSIPASDSDAVAWEDSRYGYRLDIVPANGFVGVGVDAFRRDSTRPIVSSSTSLRDASADVQTEAADFAEMFVRELRQTLFPPDANLLAEMASTLHDGSAPIAVRYETLKQLDHIARRSDVQASGEGVAIREALVGGAIAVAAATSDARTRAGIWLMLRGRRDTRLIQPLSDAVLYDASEAVRLEAARTLAEYADDGSGRAVLETAGQSDPSSEVRRTARWAALDAQGRHELIVAALFDTSLADAERLAPLLRPPIERSGPIGSDTEIVIDAGTASMIGELIAREGDERTRLDLVQRLGGLRSESLVPVIIERLGNDPAATVRVDAATLLLEHLTLPGVRPALENAVASDPVDAVRRAASRVLAAPPARAVDRP